jgi:serine/threonine-protein kinase
MTLKAGMRLGQHEILAPLGAGGMGEVFRARDSKLGREVALKVLPEEFARDPERLARFEQEARLLAALNHPRIAAIYGLEEAGGVRFLVMELAPGETLAERIGRGALPADEAFSVCRQIAEALEAAHERGIVHRDLKPANVKVTPDGGVKVLDFGLAKAFGPIGSAGAVEASPGGAQAAGTGSDGAARAGRASDADDLSQSPTLTVRSPTGAFGGTQQGVILGTAAYMSPEQARGKRVDRRTDIWSFGCVLYETLTGRSAFSGETISDTISAILRSEPDWGLLPDSTPRRARELLRRCLHKDHRRRLRDIGDARIEIEEILSGGLAAGELAGPDARRPRRGERLLWLGLTLPLAIAAGWAGLLAYRGAGRARSAAFQGVARLQVELPADAPLDAGVRAPLALSPDGTRLVYVAARPGGRELYLRPLDRYEAEPLPGTEGAEDPFFSPDGKWVGFFAEGKIKKISLSGGLPISLCDAQTGRGAAWGSDGAIYFIVRKRLSRVSADGGEPEPLSQAGSEWAGFDQRAPHVLPGAGAALLTLSKGFFSEERLAALSLRTGETKVVLYDAVSPHYVSSGHLLFTRKGTLFAVPFSLERLEALGAGIPVQDGIVTVPAIKVSHFTLSAAGALAYVPAPQGSVARTLLWVDRKGEARALSEVRHMFVTPRLSPDGRRLAVGIQGDSWDVWIHDRERGTMTRLTHEGDSLGPTWSADGRRVIFGSNRSGRWGIWRQSADGGGKAEQLLESEHEVYPSTCSPDGRFLLFHEGHPETANDIWVLPLEGEREPRPFLRTPFVESAADFSPDGRWVVYISDESGRMEVYVQPFPGPGGKIQISTEGGFAPTWTSGGREILYREGKKVMVVSVAAGPELRVSKPRLLFESPYLLLGGSNFAFDVTPDGQRLVMLKSNIESVPTRIHVILNWAEELKRRVPVPGD